MPDNPLDQFTALVQPCIRREAPEAFWDAAPAFSALVASGHVTKACREALEQLITDPCHFEDWRPSEWVLCRGPGHALALSVFDTPRRYVHALPFYAFYAPVGSEPLAYTRYRLPAAYRNPVFEPGLKLAVDGEGLVNPGEVLALRTREFAYDFHLPRPVMVLKLSTAPMLPLEWLFQKDTLQSWQANDADLTSTQLRVAADVLGKFAHQSSLGALKLLTRHGHHAVRWTAIQNLGRINRSEAMAALQAAVDDPHPHIQRAVRKTLGQITTTLTPNKTA